MSYYASILLTYFFIDVIAALGLDIQVGLSGTLNFGYILFQAVGAYTYAVLTLGSPSHWVGIQTYFGGLTLPFPLPIIIAMITGALASYLAGVLVLRRLRSDYQAIALVSLMLVCYTIVVSTPGLFNSTTGLAAIPHPLASALPLSPSGYEWAYAGFCGVLALIAFVLIRVVYRSPFGRLMAAYREGEQALQTFGKNTFGMVLTTTTLGGALAGLSGALLVGSVGAWSTGTWSFFETIVFFAAIIVGGVGNSYGILLGVAVLQIGITEGVTYLPQFGPAGFTDFLQQVLVGVILIVVLWLRPQGLFPERRPRLAALADPARR
jgi:branched-chain amino acid transport system permease protein